MRIYLLYGYLEFPTENVRFEWLSWVTYHGGHGLRLQ
jgi:hypothetical protein